MIDIVLNGKVVNVKSSLTLSQLLTEHSYPSGAFAVAVNETFVPRSCYVATIINAGDRVEIVTAMQGG